MILARNQSIRINHNVIRYLPVRMRFAKLCFGDAYEKKSQYGHDQTTKQAQKRFEWIIIRSFEDSNVWIGYS